MKTSMSSLEDSKYQRNQRMLLTELGSVFAKAPSFNGSTHFATYHRQFEAAARLNKWTEEEKGLSLILALKGPVAELIQKVPSDSQNVYAELTKALELRYGDQHLCEVYREQLKVRRQRSGAVSYTHLAVFPSVISRHIALYF